MKHLSLLIRLFFFLQSYSLTILFSQGNYNVSGKVTDADTREPLAFVNILVTGTKTGISTDIDGKFSLHSYQPIKSIQLTYVGYYTLIYTIPEKKTENLQISLQRRIFDLREVVILPTINPAHRIIDSVLANRYQNDPEKLKTFSYTSYEKTIFTAKLDTVLTAEEDSSYVTNIDTLAVADTTISDSSMAEIKDFFSKQDIAIMETVVERKFMAPDRNYENVKANRISGFQDPIFVFLVSQVQSTSFYREFFHILDKSYINPISTGSTNKYIFIIEDTLYTERGDSVFVISYRPRPNTNFDALEGVLYINSYKWAIQNAIARPAKEEGISIKIQQMYDLVDNEQWFPVQLNTDLIMPGMEIRSGNVRAKFVGIGKSYLRDIVINPDLVRRQFATLGVDVDPDSHKMPESYWNAYRIDTLSQRDKNTYAFLDSIGREANFDKISRSFETIMNGRIPWKFLDIDLDKIIKYNDYQGFYLGLGLHTNDKVSRYFKVGGFWGYGFGDMTTKYGGDISVILNRRNEIELKAAYFFDAIETGGFQFYDDNESLFRGQNWRSLLIKQMNPTQSISAGLSFRALRDFKFNTAFEVATKWSNGSYLFGIQEEGITIGTDEFRFTNVKFGFRFAFREQFIVTKRARISLGTKYPVVWFNYTRGLEGVLNSAFDYNKFDLKVEETFFTKYLGSTTIQFRAGLVDRAIPESDLYNGNGSYLIVMVFSPNSFATMRMNEFLLDRYVAVYFTHNFGKLRNRERKFNPELAIATNIGFGTLAHDGNHLNVSYQTMDKGYYESGLLINHLLDLSLYTIGVGAFYRYGPYGFDQPEKNIAFKVTVVFPFTFNQ